MNELPFKEYFNYCDASGDDNWKKSSKCPSYVGHIGKNFRPKLQLKPIVAFRRIPGRVEVYPQSFLKTLNNDGKYLYQISHAIQNGVVPQNLAVKFIGHLHKARYFLQESMKQSLMSIGLITVEKITRLLK